MSATHFGFGTLAWAQASGGELSLREHVREIAKGTLVILRTAPAQVRQRLGLRNPRAFDYDLDRLPVPDSSIAKQAEALCRDASSPMLVNHCWRTYAWGMILAAHDGLRPDPELFYVASMLHDLALTDQFRAYAPMPCFGARAALLASDWARQRGWSETRSATLADAICLHLNVAVSCEHGAEAHLLQAGAGLDVIGLRHWQLTPQTVAAVLDRYPRHNMKQGASPLFDAEAHHHTRAQLLNRWLMFGPLVRHSQFDE
ncbi:MAG: hypothetical protein ACRERC_27145 [Candidatus Binatia bacterium]